MTDTTTPMDPDGQALLDELAGLVTDVSRKLEELIDLRLTARAQQIVLRKLSDEVTALLGVPGVREAMGHTAFSVLALRNEEAQKVLAQGEGR